MTHDITSAGRTRCLQLVRSNAQESLTEWGFDMYMQIYYILYIPRTWDRKLGTLPGGEREQGRLKGSRRFPELVPHFSPPLSYT